MLEDRGVARRCNFVGAFKTLEDSGVAGGCNFLAGDFFTDVPRLRRYVSTLGCLR
jgi:hypothetical protein